MVSLQVLCLALTTVPVFSQTIVGNRPVDCAYGPWSEYLPVLGNPDQVYRVREVLRRERFGGAPCTGVNIETKSIVDLQTPSLSKFLSMFLSGDRREVTLASSLISKGQVPQSYTLARDIVFVIDTTLFQAAMPIYKSLLSNLVGSICGDVGIQESNNAFSLITYDSTRTDLIYTFNQQQSVQAIQNKILSVQPSDGLGKPSLLRNALELAKEQITTSESGTRPYNIAHKDVLLFVTYRTVCSNGLSDIIQQLKVHSRVYVVVLGESGDKSAPPPNWCLRYLASAQFDYHFLSVKSFEDLKEFSRWTLDITSYVNPCEDQTNSETPF